MTPRPVVKPWGRTDLWPGFEAFSDGESVIGELWFESALGVTDALLIKYIFTSQALSVQVHPDDGAARAQGQASGKEEAWIVLAADAGATIGLGLRHSVDRQQLRSAALDGTIVDLVDWRSVSAGDVILVPPGTIHAIGAGITLIEVQQNIDLTYRLFDYGRPRALHLDDGIPVAITGAYRGEMGTCGDTGAGAILCRGTNFEIEQLSANQATAVSGTAWLIPVAGGGLVDAERFAAGECWRISGPTNITLDYQSLTLLARARAPR